MLCLLFIENTNLKVEVNMYFPQNIFENDIIRRFIIDQLLNILYFNIMEKYQHTIFFYRNVDKIKRTFIQYTILRDTILRTFEID